MKKFSLMLVLLLAGISFAQAQNANRSGFFMELSGGLPIGKIYGEAHIDGGPDATDAYLKGGFDLNFSLGYRLAVSKNWAIGLQAGIEDNLAAAKYVLKAPIVMLSGRWTSNDFRNGMSFYLQPQFGFANAASASCCYIPAGIDLGVNLTNHLCLGLDLTCYANPDSSYGYAHKKRVYSSTGEARNLSMAAQTYLSAKIKLGYRF